MKRQTLFRAIVVIAVVLLFAASLSLAQEGETPASEPLVLDESMGTAFTYQGQLEDGNGPVNASCDFRFTLYDEETGGDKVGETIGKTAIVNDGLFTVALDFGAGAFDGDARWLQISACCPSACVPVALDPRQELTPAPYALALPGLYTQQHATSPNLIGGYGGNNVMIGVYGAAIGGGGSSGYANQITDDYGIVAGGSSNRAGDNGGTTADSPHATVGGGYANIASAEKATIAGGSSNLASGSSATVGGGYYNQAEAKYSVIAGGGPMNEARPDTTNNVAYDNYGVIGGGGGNRAGSSDSDTENAKHATVGGGYDNAAGGADATVGGGRQNRANADMATVGGGLSNAASSEAAIVGGGWYNAASGEAATVGGGYYNQAQAKYSVIAGGGPSDEANPSTTNNVVYDDYGTIGGGGSNRAGSDDGYAYSDTYATVSGGYSNAASNDFATVGGGYSNTASGYRATVGGGYSNSGSGDAATVGGGYDNTADDEYATVGGGYSNTASGASATVGGGYDNTADDEYATVGGGYSNTASGASATVGGGYDNTANGENATVGGGYSNSGSGDAATVGGGYDNLANEIYATVGGGYSNVANGHHATVGGGDDNGASGLSATVGGGYSNGAAGNYATVGGGYSNSAPGEYATVPGGILSWANGYSSFAAGRRAKAYNDGCFVWADSRDVDVSCLDNNRTIFRSTGGFYIYTNRDLNTGMYLAADGSSWNAVSDRALKEKIRPVDAHTLLQRLNAIEIGTWNYKAQDPTIRHIGPMAQDFNALLPDLGGEGETHINTLDANGVALAAIQGLYTLSQEQASRIERLEAQNTGLEARLSTLEKAAVPSGAASSNLLSGWVLMGGGLLATGIVIQRQRKERES